MKRSMDRRTFLKTLGAVGVGAVVTAQLEACAKAPAASPTVAPTGLPQAGATPSTVSTTAQATTAATTAASAPTSPAATAASATEAATSAATAAATSAATAAPTSAAAMATPMPAGALDAYTFFTPPESAFVEAAVARIIPKDDLGPGALEAGVAHFIDNQLSGGYGIFARHYNAGPWMAGTPQQGYQLRLVPRQIYRLGIREANAYANQTFQKTFDQLTTQQQDQVFTDMSGGKVKFNSMPAGLFFSTLMSDTKDGFFADPDYGGNRDKVGWKLVGFPGVPVAYNDWIEKYNQPFTGPVRSIGDMEAQGHTG